MQNDEITDEIQAQIAELRAAFDMFDDDNDGRIDADELSRALAALGQQIAIDEAQRMIAFVDHDGTRTLSFIDFVDLLEPRPLNEDPEADLRNVFNVIDDDNDGFIDITELTRAAARSGTFDPAEAASIVQQVDTDRDGRIGVDEFIRFMMRNNAS